MTVKDIFELRREGRVEEAYNAILPMYRVHHGKYTSSLFFGYVKKKQYLCREFQNTNCV